MARLVRPTWLALAHAKSGDPALNRRATLGRRRLDGRRDHPRSRFAYADHTDRDPRDDGDGLRAKAESRSRRSRRHERPSGEVEAVDGRRRRPRILAARLERRREGRAQALGGDHPCAIVLSLATMASAVVRPIRPTLWGGVQDVPLGGRRARAGSGVGGAVDRGDPVPRRFRRPNVYHVHRGEGPPATRGWPRFLHDPLPQRGAGGQIDAWLADQPRWQDASRAEASVPHGGNTFRRRAREALGCPGRRNRPTMMAARAGGETRTRTGNVFADGAVSP